MNFTQAKAGISYAMSAGLIERKLANDTEASSKSPIQTPKLFGRSELDDELTQFNPAT
jgi:hypothetical protein